MKIVIIGAKGMLGKDLGRVFFDPYAPAGSGSRLKRRDFILYLLDKDELDITDKESVQKVFSDLKPDIVINAAAYTDVDGCETNRELAMKVNGVAPGYLAEASRDIGAVLVHYSTDYVFDGNKKEGYDEDDEPGDAINFYGESKLAGERAVREAGGSYYIIRTSWLFGGWPSYAKASEGKPKNFVETILKLAQEINRIKVVNDQYGKPTFSLDLARKTRELIESKLVRRSFSEGGKDFGVYHITNEPTTTWYDFAKEIVEQIKNTRDNTSIIPSILPCASSEFPRPAKRPQYSILKNTKLSPMRPWQEALREYLSLRKEDIIKCKKPNIKNIGRSLFVQEHSDW